MANHNFFLAKIPSKIGDIPASYVGLLELQRNLHHGTNFQGIFIIWKASNLASKEYTWGHSPYHVVCSGFWIFNYQLGSGCEYNPYGIPHPEKYKQTSGLITRHTVSGGSIICLKKWSPHLQSDLQLMGGWKGFSVIVPPQKKGHLEQQLVFSFFKCFTQLSHQLFTLSVFDSKRLNYNMFLTLHPRCSNRELRRKNGVHRDLRQASNNLWLVAVLRIRDFPRSAIALVGGWTNPFETYYIVNMFFLPNQGWK